MGKTKVLWLSPNLNHYKIRFLDYLAQVEDIDLTVFSGSGRKGKGDGDISGDWSFKQTKLDIDKGKFGRSFKVIGELKKIAKDFDWILIPAEKKNLFLFLYSLILKKRYKDVKLFSYNHPVLKSANGKVTYIDRSLTKFFYRYLDRVVFYTKESYSWAITEKLINPKKAFWANNTIDTIEISKYQNKRLLENTIVITFIGRLIPSKQLGLLLEYYSALKKKILNFDLILEIIGDGPEREIIKNVLDKDLSIRWHGLLVDEAKISAIMNRSSIVFIPGHSGLSINHAFAYGVPYVTLSQFDHAPEINFLKNGINGFILEGSFEDNLKTLMDLLTNTDKLTQFSINAKNQGEYLSLQNWVEQMKSNLLHE